MFATETPIIAAFVYVVNIGAALLPVNAEITDSADAEAATALSTSTRSSANESTPEPSVGVAAIAASTASKFSLVTPVIPRSANEAAVSGGDIAVPDAVPMIPFTTSDSETSSD